MTWNYRLLLPRPYIRLGIKSSYATNRSFVEANTLLLGEMVLSIVFKKTLLLKGLSS